VLDTLVAVEEIDVSVDIAMVVDVEGVG